MSDGVLTAAQAASLNLEDAEWVVLSGCDTGLGDIEASEGVLGLRRAFQEAGARTVVASLWPVDDEATRGWMASLYRYRFANNYTAARALQAADRFVEEPAGGPFKYASVLLGGVYCGGAGVSGFILFEAQNRACSLSRPRL